VSAPNPALASIVKPEPSGHPLREKLSKEINGPAFVADLLLMRGIEEKEQARDFFLAALGDSQSEAGASALLGLDKAVDLLLAAREAGEKVVVHGDYDVDGVTATALLYLGLEWCGFDAGWFIPNRFDEGYGISFASVDKLKARGARWLVSVDTGIAAVAEIARAKELGLGVIVTDHHQASGALPPADAILNPNQPGCPYPNKGLSGVGVAFKLMNAIARRTRGESAERFLDLLALGSLADNVPLIGENRRLVKAGLRLLSATQNVGLRALLEKVGVERARVSSGEILFKVTPMLNAMGRMGSPEISLRLLLARDEAEAAACLDRMAAENARRRKLDQSITEDAFRMIEADPSLRESPCLVVASPEWHEGVIGIVAARLVERYRRPCFVIAVDRATGLAKGSGRTVPGFNLHKALAGAADMLEKWGGHYHACGLTIAETRVPAFREAMVRCAHEHLKDRDFTPRVAPAAELPLSLLNEENMVWLQRFEPFGPLNELPMFYCEDVEVLAPPRIVGEKHLKLTVGSLAGGFDAIGFNMGYLKDYLADRPRIARMAYHPEWNTFRGQRRIQLRIVALE
jgi:single-stranded-DNA-specific exonuclease